MNSIDQRNNWVKVILMKYYNFMYIQIYLCVDRIDNKKYEIKCLPKNQFEDSIVYILYIKVTYKK